MPSHNSLSWRKDIDGLRGIAVLLVIFNHLGSTFFEGGFVGVDIFFVISGFLITRQLVSEYSTNANKTNGFGYISLLGFYLRRIRRILPAAIFIILFVTLYDFVTTNNIKAIQNAIEGIWAAFFMMNWHLIAESTNYFQLGTEPSKFIHYWSLAVEEQYYLIAPIAFMGIVRMHGLRIGRRKIWWNIRLEYFFATVAILSFALSIITTYIFPKFAYFSTFTRAWQIALGAFFAVFTFKVRILREKQAFYYSYLGLILIVLSCTFINSSSSYPGFMSLMPTLGACLLLISGETKSNYFKANRLLEFSIFKYFGRISFSLYLIHWPLIVLNSKSTTESFTLFKSLYLFLIMTLLSQFVYSFVESPFRKIQISERWLESQRRNFNLTSGLPFKLPNSVATVIMGFVIFIFVLLGLYGGSNKTPNFTNPGNSIEFNLGSDKSGMGENLNSAADNISLAELQMAWVSKISDALLIRKIPASLESNFAKIDNKLFWEQASNCSSELTKLSCVQGSSPSKILVTGDSHARMFDQALKKAFMGSEVTIVGKYRGNCKYNTAIPWDKASNTPVTECQEFRDSTNDWIKQYRPNLIVVAQASNVVFSENGKQLSPENGFRSWSKGLRPGLEPLTSSGSKLLLIGQVPGAAPLIDCVGKDLSFTSSCFSNASSVEKWNSVSRQTVESLGGTFLDVSDWLCVKDLCPPIIDNEFVLLDGSHISDDFSAKLGPLFRVFIKEKIGIN